MSADNLGCYAYNPETEKWVCWMAFMSDDDQRPYGAIEEFDTEGECVDYFRRDEEDGTFYEYGWGKVEWLGEHGGSYPRGSKQWLADQIDDIAGWLTENRKFNGDYVDRELCMQIGRLKEYAQQIRTNRG
jgi:hypothetical protein